MKLQACKVILRQYNRDIGKSIAKDTIAIPGSDNITKMPSQGPYQPSTNDRKANSANNSVRHEFPYPLKLTLGEVLVFLSLP